MGMYSVNKRTLQTQVNPNLGERPECWFELLNPLLLVKSRSRKVDLQLQLGPPPVSPLRVVPDRVPGPHPGQDC